jgi:DNA (cytosine-5)-methyltransferase 1
MADTDTKRIVSLFSGCGGLDRGFENMGYDIVFANDRAEHVEETFNDNHDTDITIQDIRELDYDEIPDCDGIVGGPPCQTWSLAGNLDGSDDERGGVFYDYIDIIQNKQPAFFVTENVPGIVSKSNIDEFEDILYSFQDIGYTVDWKKMDAEKYGVPQARTRVIIVGVRNDIDYDYQFPESGDETVQAGHLPACPSKETDKDGHDPDDLHLPNHEHYIGSYSSRFMSRNRVRKWDEPAYTVLAGARYQKIHPQAPKMEKIQKDEWVFKDGHEEEYRRYSVREAARLQTFPDDFIFHYDNIKDGYSQVGNAVPVKLAESVAESLLPLTKDLSDSPFTIEV